LRSASIGRDTRDTTGARAPIFDKNKTEVGFETTGQFVPNRAPDTNAAPRA